MHRFFTGMGTVFALGLVGIGCAPEKPSDAVAGQMQVELDEVDDLEDPQAVVARIDGEEITREEFNRRIDGLAEFARVRLQSAEQRQDFLARIVEFEVLADVAERRGYGEHARTRQAMNETMVDLMVEEWLQDEVSIADIDEQDRRAHFEDHEDDFFRPERRRLARVVADDEAQAQALRQRWVDEASSYGEDERERMFRRFAFRHSRERDTGDRGGDVGWREPGDDQEFGDEVFDWEPGEVYGPFEVDGRWMLKMVVEKEESRAPTAEQLEQQITTRIYEERRRQARRDWIDGLTADIDVEVWDQRLEDVNAPEQPGPLRLGDVPRVTVGEETSDGGHNESANDLEQGESDEQQ